MDRDTDLFVNAFWLKCREVVRPEIDSRIRELRRVGYGAEVSTQEFSSGTDRLPDPAGPSLMLVIHPGDATEGAARSTLEFRGDVARQVIDVVADGARTHTYELAALGTTQTKAEIEGWLSGRAATARV